jgi:hypothetical protein
MANRKVQVGAVCVFSAFVLNSVTLMIIDNKRISSFKKTDDDNSKDGSLIFKTLDQIDQAFLKKNNLEEHNYFKNIRVILYTAMACSIFQGLHCIFLIIAMFSGYTQPVLTKKFIVVHASFSVVCVGLFCASFFANISDFSTMKEWQQEATREFNEKDKSNFNKDFERTDTYKNFINSLIIHAFASLFMIVQCFTFYFFNKSDFEIVSPISPSVRGEIPLLNNGSIQARTNYGTIQGSTLTHSNYSTVPSVLSNRGVSVSNTATTQMVDVGFQNQGHLIG